MDQQHEKEELLREVFTPFEPIESEEYLRGRDVEMERLKEVLLNRGQQALLFGTRGAGKTSIAKVYMKYAAKKGYEVIRVQCSEGYNFETISQHILRKAGIDLESETTETSTEVYAEAAGEAEGSIPLVGKAKGSGKGGLKKSNSKTSQIQRHLNCPDWLAEMLLTKDSKAKYLIVLDEYEEITCSRTHSKIAGTLKVLSDEHKHCKMLVVGVSETTKNLIRAHKSLPRALAEIHLKNISDTALSEIIESGMSILRCSISKDIIDTIIQKSHGQPYFTHLMCLRSAEIAIKQGGQYEITQTIFRDALIKCAIDAAPHLQVDLDKIEGHKHTAQYTLVLFAASKCGSKGFSIGSVQQKVEDILTGRNIASPNKEYYRNRFPKGTSCRKAVREALNWLANKDILMRPNNKRGFYAFTDPRMASYISMDVDKRGFNS